MSKYFLYSLLLIFISCNEMPNSSLEINFTSKNQDTIKEIKAFYLSSLTHSNKRVSFTDIKCISPNKFIFKPLEKDTYTGLIRIKKNDGTYNIPVDIIVIDSTINIISKELNLGTVKFP